MIVGLCSSQPTDEEQTWWMDLLPNATANYSLGGTFQVGDDGLGNTGLWIKVGLKLPLVVPLLNMSLGSNF